MNILSIVQGFKIPFSQTQFQFGPPQLAIVNQEERFQINSEIKEMLRKGAVQQVKSEPAEFLSNLFLVNKKDGRHRLIINPKFLNSFIPYQHFKMEKMHLIKGLLQEHNFLIKIDLKDAYFGIPLDSSRHKLKKIYLFSMGRKFIRIPLLMFWTGSSPSDFHKTPEDPNCLTKEDQCKNNNILGRHVNNGPDVERNFASKGGIDFSVRKFRFCDKFKKVATNTNKGNRVFGVSGKFRKQDVSLASGKSFGYPKQMRKT